MWCTITVRGMGVCHKIRSLLLSQCNTNHYSGFCFSSGEASAQNRLLVWHCATSASSSHLKNSASLEGMVQDLHSIFPLLPVPFVPGISMKFSSHGYGGLRYYLEQTGFFSLSVFF